MSALPVDHATLTKDILELVRKTSLEALTSKFVRTQMETKHGVKLGDFRKQIDAIIHESIVKVEAEKSAKPAPEPMEITTNGDARSSSSSSSSPSLSPSPPRVVDNKKSRKRPAPSPTPSPNVDNSSSSFLLDSFADDDNDIYSAIKRRRAATQRTIQRKPTKPAKKTKEPGAAKKKTAFTRVCVLSDELSAVLDRKYLRRSDVVKMMWQYFRDHNLLDPKDRRFVIPDLPMRAVLGAKRVQAFGMMSRLKTHIKDVDFLDEETRLTAMREIEKLEEDGELDMGPSTSAPKSKNLPIEDDSDSSKSSDDEPPAKMEPAKKKASPKKQEPPKKKEKQPAKVKTPSPEPETSTPSPIVEDPPPEPQTSIQQMVVKEAPQTEEPRAGKLVLRISKKNDRVVSVAVRDDYSTTQQQPQQPRKTIEPLANSHASTSNGPSSQTLPTDTSDNEGPPKLDPEVPNNVASSSSSGSSSSGSDSSSSDSSGSDSSSSAASSPDRGGKPPPARNGALANDLRLSESDSDA